LKKQAVKKFIKPNITKVLFMFILCDSKNLIAQGCATPANSPEM
jgi:hypothetical protein